MEDDKDFNLSKGKDGVFGRWGRCEGSFRGKSRSSCLDINETDAYYSFKGRHSSEKCELLKHTWELLAYGDIDS